MWSRAGETRVLPQHDSGRAIELIEALAEAPRLWEERDPTHYDSVVRRLELLDYQDLVRKAQALVKQDEKAWVISLIVTSEDPEWVDRDIPENLGPLKVIGFADTKRGLDEGFAREITLEEAERIRL